MRTLKLALIAAAATAAISSTAFAADLIVDTPITTPAVVDNSFNWDGAYIGLFAAGQTAPAAYGIGADLGVNALMGGLLIGGELEVVALTGPHFSTQGTVKLGTSINDSAILYAYSGVGTRTVSSWYVPVGIGAEFKVADNLGLKTEAQCRRRRPCRPAPSVAVKVGLNWHF